MVEPTLNRVEFQREQFTIQQPFHKLQQFAELQGSEVYDHFIERMVVRLRAHVLGEQIETIRYPADWFQAFKQRWFPGWLLKHYPAREKVWRVCFVYPSLSLRRELRPEVAIYAGMDGSRFPFTPHEDRVERLKKALRDAGNENGSPVPAYYGEGMQIAHYQGRAERVSQIIEAALRYAG